MNHDATHCDDYLVAKCPKTCYRAQLTQDLRDNQYRFLRLPISWANFKGTDECPITNKQKKERQQMKARVPLPNNIKTAVKSEVAAEWKKIQKEKALEMAQRCLKVYLYVLNRDYGFGKKRLTDFYNRCGEFMKTSDDNEVFWEQLDRVIIDTYGFSELGRDYTDRGKAIR